MDFKSVGNCLVGGVGFGAGEGGLGSRVGRSLVVPVVVHVVNVFVDVSIVRTIGGVAKRVIAKLATSGEKSVAFGCCSSVIIFNG